MNSGILSGVVTAILLVAFLGGSPGSGATGARRISTRRRDSRCMTTTETVHESGLVLVHPDPDGRQHRRLRVAAVVDPRKRADGKPEAPTTGHVWDEDMTEGNQPLPKWWMNLFYLTIVFAFAYLVIYPSLGSFAGVSGWTSQKEHAADVAAAQAKLEPILARFRNQPVAALALDPEATQLGHSVFANNCATCHGSDARGARGFPNLTDQDWLWGGDPETVLTTIRQGRLAAMPALKDVLGEQGVTAAAAYVQSLSGRTVDAALAQAGAQHFQTICAACHGPDGKGNPLWERRISPTACGCLAAIPRRSSRPSARAA